MRMRRKKKRFIGIRTKLSACFILLLFIVMAFIDVTVYQIYKTDIEQTEMNSMQDASEILSENIKNLLNNIEEKLMNEVKRSRLFEHLTDGAELSAQNMERKLRGFGILMHFRGLECKNILVLDHEEHMFFCDTGKTGMTLAQYQEKSVYQHLIQEKTEMFPARGCTIWRSYADASDEIYILKSYIDPFSLEYCGIVCLTIDREYFHVLLGEHNFDIAILDENGDPLFCSTGTAAHYAVETSEKYLCSDTSIRRSRGNWKMISFISREVVFRDLIRLIRMLVFAELLLGIVIVFAVHKITEGFLWNVTALTDNFKRIQKQETVQKIVPHSQDETTYLCERFDSMYRQLQENAEQMIQTNTLLDKAEYNALLAQINPHFLYNSLESVSAMARIKGQGDIAGTIHMLSHLLRGALSSGEQEITLSRELEYISCYLEMQKLITGGRITWDIDVDESLLDCRVPRLLLQPIVENSILHGVDEMLNDAVIIITADVREEKLVLTVSDNGKGAQQEMLDALLAAEITEDTKERRAHIGIQSVLKRIHILYGEAYGMTMESELEKGTTVRIYLPYDKKEDTGC